jgi:hypothetical protein
MTRYDNARYYIIKELNNKFNFEEFELVCASKKITPMTIHEYYFKLGLLEWAKEKYPDIPEIDAYLKIVDYLNRLEEENRISSNAQQKVGCGSCGGGKVV